MPRQPNIPIAEPWDGNLGENLQDIFRFKAGVTVWVRDAVAGQRGGYRIVEAKVNEQHYHPGRHPFYPDGEGYSLEGDLCWDCYPGCRVFATRAEALAARMGKLKADNNA